MSSKQPDAQSCSIVLIGAFNPSIFQPAWFAAEGLVRKPEAENVTIEVVHPQLVSLNFGAYRLQVSAEQFVTSTSLEPTFDVIRDLTLSTFKLLRHTPITKMGVSREMHFQMPGDVWKAFGNRLAPTQLWENVLDSPAMRSLTIEESPRRDGRAGYLRVRIEPSSEVKPGVRFRVNDHFSVQDSRVTLGAGAMMDALKETWDDGRFRAGQIISRILEESVA